MQPKKLIRGAGILLPVTALPSSYGIGTLGVEARNFVDLLVDLKQKYWQVLPLGPTSYGDSPYQSFSTFAGNPYMIDLDELIKKGYLQYEEVKGYSFGDDQYDIDYSLMFLNRLQLLRKAYERFPKQDESFDRFCEERSFWIKDYALFMALKNHFQQKEWQAWEPAIRDREEEALAEYREKLKEEIRFQEFLQYEFWLQWISVKKYANDHGIQIIGDIPLYVAADSADVWTNREHFELDSLGYPRVVTGCPPDAFSEEGQKWGNPVYNWNHMKLDGYDWWRLRMKSNAELYDVLCIDHFIDIFRYYTIASEETLAKNGKWHKGPGKELTDLIEESLGAEKSIIADDLGTVIPGVKRMLKKTGWPGMKVLIFAFDGNTSNEYLPHNYDNSNFVVYGGTHDSGTIMGYFDEKSEYELAFLYEYLGVKGRDEIIDGMIRLGYSSIADVVIFQMQDLLKLGNEARMNLPSTVGRNWKWRMPRNCMNADRRAYIRTISAIYNR